jgi:hypothetical protein
MPCSMAVVAQGTVREMLSNSWRFGVPLADDPFRPYLYGTKN